MTAFFIITIVLLFATIGLIGYRMFFRKEDPLVRLEQEGNFEDCIVAYEELLSDNKIDLERIWKLINLYEKTGQKEKVIEKLNYTLEKKFIPKDMTEYDVRKRLALEYFKIGEEEKSIRLLIELIKEKEDDATLPYIIAVILIGQEAPEKAITFLKTASKIDEKDPNIYYHLGVAYAYIDELALAKKSFEKSIARMEKPRNDLYLFLGIAEYIFKDYKKAFQNLNKVTDGDADEIENYVWAIRILGHLVGFEKNGETAKDYFLKARQLSVKHDLPINDDITFDIVCYFLNNYDVQNASEYFNLLPENYPDEELYQKFSELISSTQELETYDEGGELSEDLKEEIKKYVEHYYKHAITPDIIWNIGKIKREVEFPVENYITESLLETMEKRSNPVEQIKSPNCDTLKELDRKSFLEIAREILAKLQFEIIEENYQNDSLLFTHGDGVDFYAQPKAEPDTKYLVQIRRWNNGTVGELVLKNLEDTITTINLHKGLFITTAELTSEAMRFVERSNLINVIARQQLEFLLHGFFNSGKKPSKRDRILAGTLG